MKNTSTLSFFPGGLRFRGREAQYLKFVLRLNIVNYSSGFAAFARSRLDYIDAARAWSKFGGFGAVGSIQRKVKNDDFV